MGLWAGWNILPKPVGQGPRNFSARLIVDKKGHFGQDSATFEKGCAVLMLVSVASIISSTRKNYGY